MEISKVADLLLPQGWSNFRLEKMVIENKNAGIGKTRIQGK